MDFTGVALGAGVNQYMKMDEMARQNRALKIQEDAAKLAQEKGSLELDQLRTVNDLGTKYRNINAAAARGDFSDPTLQGFVNDYNNNQGAFNNGYTMGLGQDAKGGRAIHFYDKDGAVAHTEPYNPRNINRMIGDAYRTELSYAAPDYYYKNYQLSQKDRELGTDEQYKLNVIPGIHADDRASRERVAQIQTGPQWANVNKPHVGNAIQMVDANGNAVLVNPVTDSQGRTTYNQSQLPAGLKLPPRGAAANPYTTLTDVEKINLTAYNKAIGELPPPVLTGNADKDARARANYDGQLAALQQRYQVGHLTGGGQPNGGMNVGTLGGQPAAPAAPAPKAEQPKGEGLKKPKSYEQIQQEFKGWKAMPAGQSFLGAPQFVVERPDGTRMNGDDFESQYGFLPQVLPNK